MHQSVKFDGSVGNLVHMFLLLRRCLQLAALTPSRLHSGAICIPTFLPLTVLFLISMSRSPEASVFQWPPSLPSAEQLWDPLAPAVLLAWVALHALIYLMPIGKVYWTLNKLLKKSFIIYDCWTHYILWN